MVITGASQAVLCKRTHLPMQETEETWVRSLGREDLLKEGIATQYSCLENPMDRGAQWATVHRITESDTTKVA